MSTCVTTRRGSRVVLALVAIAFLIAVAVVRDVANPVGAQPLDGGATRSVHLEPGWNLLGWTGSSATAAEALRFAPALARPVYSFDGADQAFRSYQPGTPAPVNSLRDLEHGDAVWLFSEERTIWPQPAVRRARAVPLVAGFNLVSWTGPTHTTVEDALVSIVAGVTAAYWYDPVLRRYLTYRPGFADAFSDLRVLHYGEALWLQVDRAMVWEQPDPLASRCAPFPDPNARLGGWLTFDAGAVTIEYQAGSAAAAHREAVADAASAALAEVEDRVAITADGIVRVRLYESAALLQAATGTSFNGFSEPSQRTVHIRCGASGLGIVHDLPSLHHELAHIVTVRAHGPYILFLAEGIAGWTDGRIGALPLQWWIDAGQRTRYPRVVDLLADADYLAVPDTSLALATAALLTRYLVEERGGLDRFWGLWATVQGVGLDLAPQIVYGASWGELDRDMREALGILP